MRRAHQLRGLDGVVAVHRVVAADAHERDVERVALARQRQVGEQAGVAQVVDGLAAQVDHEAGRRVGRAVRRRRGVPRGDQPDPAAVELHGAAEVRVGHVLDALLRRSRWPAPRSRSPGRRCAWRCRPCRRSGRRGRGSAGCASGSSSTPRPPPWVAGQERVDQQAGVALGQLEAGVAQEADVHVSVSSSSWSCGRLRRSSSRASSQPTATPTSIPIRVSSASSVGCAVTRRPRRARHAPGAPVTSWASPNQPPACSASARIALQLRRARATRRSASREALGVARALRTAASSCSSVNTARDTRRARAREERQRQAEQRARPRRRRRRRPRSPRSTASGSSSSTAAITYDADQVVAALVAAARRAGGRPRARRTAGPAPRRWRRAPGRAPGRRAAADVQRDGERGARGAGQQEDEHHAEPARSGARAACRRSPPPQRDELVAQAVVHEGRGERSATTSSSSGTTIPPTSSRETSPVARTSEITQRHGDERPTSRTGRVSGAMPSISSAAAAGAARRARAAWARRVASPTRRASAPACAPAARSTGTRSRTG